VVLFLGWALFEHARHPDREHPHPPELLTLRRDNIQIIDAANNRFKEDKPEKQESGEEQEKPKGRKRKEPKKQPSADEAENPSSK
jgi:hypothetical protein